MSKVSGTSRIPTFGLKAPQFKTKQKIINDISNKDIGKRVFVYEKEGTLRFIGNVHFSDGVWCGVELIEPFGKNDGVVDGVRYFSCTQNYGLMAPISKLTLRDNYDNINEKNIKIVNNLLNEPPKTLNISNNSSNESNNSKDNSTDNILNETVIIIPANRRRTYSLHKDNPVSQRISKKLIKDNTFVQDSPLMLTNNNINDIKRRRTKLETKTDNNTINILPHIKFTNCSTSNHRVKENNNTSSKETDNRDDESNHKRDSLDFDESLGILTPDQMIDGMNFQESQDIKLLDKILKFNEKLNKTEQKSELSSPNATTDYSLGIMDEQLMANLTLRTDTTMNMELPLDTIDLNSNLNRLEQTPSPEELPLDPVPIIETDPKTESTSKSKNTNSFITSITTSITSLDTGYQGDGEMSRPASRGADISPLTRRPLLQCRKPDPMTDSDFYTESDADVHEDTLLRGDRKAQVIDGTLYGVDPQAAADIYVNNRENMDSSGIFTDIESNTRNEEDSLSNVTADGSPSDSSSKTISGNSQKEIIKSALVAMEMKSDEKPTTSITIKNVTPTTTVNKENPKKRNAPSPLVCSPSSVRSPRHSAKEENANKKFKMPKRDVASKVKVMMENNSNNLINNENKTFRKPISRWDAVMNKISKTNDTIKPNLKDVKSKVFNSISINNLQTHQQNDIKKTNCRPISNLKSPNIKSRRIRPRILQSKNIENSVHSSLSDLSANVSPLQKTLGAVKKRDVVQVTQVLTASKLSPKPPQHNNIGITTTTTTTTTAPTTPTTPSSTTTTTTTNENKRVPHSTSLQDVKKKTLFSSREKKQPQQHNYHHQQQQQQQKQQQQKQSSKESGKATVKGGRISPLIRTPNNFVVRSTVTSSPKVVEALAVLVQHLVFNVDAYQVPVLKKEVEKYRLENETIKLAYKQLESSLTDKQNFYENQIKELLEKHDHELLELKNQHYEVEQRMLDEKELNKIQLCQQNDEKIVTLKVEFQKLQKTHKESVDILREENESIREQIDEKNELIEHIKYESEKLKEDYEAKEMKLKENLHNVNKENQKMKQELKQIDEITTEQMQLIKEENNRLREENDRLLSYGDNNGKSIQEVQSLRAVLDLKQKEVAELRKALAQATQRNEILCAAEEKVTALSARCEDLQLQLERKSEQEHNLISENKKLHDSFKEEKNQRLRVLQYNEELQWKLKQNKEIFSKVMEHTEDPSFQRSILNSSFNERYHTANNKSLERALSFRDSLTNNKKLQRQIEFDDISPPSSPKVKGVVEKSDSVSYVLDLDENPDVVASRIVRRSFRNSTPPKNTPNLILTTSSANKSPSNKRPRTKNPLSLSASTSSIITNNNKNEYVRSRSVSVRNDNFIWTSTPIPKNGQKDSCESIDMKLDENCIDFDNDDVDDIKLPALPSEIGRKHCAQILPRPKHLAGEAMISESNSEDESTSSSSVQL